jgi:hypothetical protein
MSDTTTHLEAISTLTLGHDSSGCPTTHAINSKLSLIDNGVMRETTDRYSCERIDGEDASVRVDIWRLPASDTSKPAVSFSAPGGQGAVDQDEVARGKRTLYHIQYDEPCVGPPTIQYFLLATGAKIFTSSTEPLRVHAGDYGVRVRVGYDSVRWVALSAGGSDTTVIGVLSYSNGVDRTDRLAIHRPAGDLWEVDSFYFGGPLKKSADAKTINFPHVDRAPVITGFTVIAVFSRVFDGPGDDRIRIEVPVENDRFAIAGAKATPGISFHWISP